MKIKLIKLVENELIKIFKRKSIYWLFALAFVGMIVYNNINPDQNPPDTYIIDTKDFPIESVEEALKNIDVNSEEFIIQMISIKRGKLWNEFEEGETAEAKFANTLDKVQPLTLNHKTGGISWKEHDIRAEQVIKRNRKTPEGSRTLWEYCQKIIDENIENGNLK